MMFIASFEQPLLDVTFLDVIVFIPSVEEDMKIELHVKCFVVAIY